jgi:hypothetical protein
VAGIYEILESRKFLDDAIQKIYVKVPKDHPYKLYYVEDMDENPFLKVVAQSVKVEKE